MSNVGESSSREPFIPSFIYSLINLILALNYHLLRLFQDESVEYFATLNIGECRLRTHPIRRKFKYKVQAVVAEEINIHHHLCFNSFIHSLVLVVSLPGEEVQYQATTNVHKCELDKGVPHLEDEHDDGDCEDHVDGILGSVLFRRLNIHPPPGQFPVQILHDMEGTHCASASVPVSDCLCDCLLSSPPPTFQYEMEGKGRKAKDVCVSTLSV